METSGKFRIVVAVCALITGLSATAPAKVIYVDDDAGGANDGSSWANAFTYLQKALAAAGTGDEIRVAQGLYRPDQGLPVVPPAPRARVANPRGAPYEAFQLKKGVAILGGFAGAGAEEPNDRDVERYGTILSGDLNGNDIDAWGPGNPVYESRRADNSDHVVESQNTDATAVLDGFTIQAAVQSGMHNLRGSPRVANCTFRQNSAGKLSGGALFCEGGQPSLSHCVFWDNSAAVVGGAVYASQAQLTFADCRFINNWATSLGGGICSVDSELSATGCVFEQNGAQEGGAVCHQQGTLILTDSEFEGNLAEKEGGAVSLMRQEAASMTRCTFRRNWTAAWGGAINNKGVHIVLEACTFSGNRATAGGAMYAYLSSLSDPNPRAEGTLVTHCLFTGNCASDSGGAFWIYFPRLLTDSLHLAGATFDGCTFADNWAPRAGTLAWPAGLSHLVADRVALTDCIVWDDKGSISPLPFGRTGDETSDGQEPTVAIRYSDVQGGWPGEGNIDADPCFAAPGHWVDGANPMTVVEPGYANAAWVDGDYHLKSQAGRWDPVGESWVQDEVTSPCINAGDPNSPVGDEPEPNGGRINMGTYGGTAEASKSYSDKL